MDRSCNNDALIGKLISKQVGLQRYTAWRIMDWDGAYRCMWTLYAERGGV